MIARDIVAREIITRDIIARDIIVCGLTLLDNAVRDWILTYVTSRSRYTFYMQHLNTISVVDPTTPALVPSHLCAPRTCYKVYLSVWRLLARMWYCCLAIVFNTSTLVSTALFGVAYIFEELI